MEVEEDEERLDKVGGEEEEDEEDETLEEDPFEIFPLEDDGILTIEGWDESMRGSSLIIPMR